MSEASENLKQRLSELAIKQAEERKRTEGKIGVQGLENAKEPPGAIMGLKEILENVNRKNK